VLKAALVALVLVLIFGSAASAQNDSVVGVGGGVSFYAATDPNVETRAGWGLVGRLRRGTGLGFSLGLAWFTADIRTDVDGEVVPLGAVTVRPLMVGASYSRLADARPTEGVRRCHRHAGRAPVRFRLLGDPTIGHRLV
jgi:hypothetical protein